VVVVARAAARAFAHERSEALTESLHAVHAHIIGVWGDGYRAVARATVREGPSMWLVRPRLLSGQRDGVPCRSGIGRGAWLSTTRACRKCHPRPGLLA
jgi:hypothetical protein